MIKYCGRPWDFTELIFKNLKQIPSDALLIHLGDICIGNDSFWHQYLNELPYKKVLCKGNHDRKSNNWYLNHGWDFVCDSFNLTYYDHQRLTFSHMPCVNYGFDYNIHGHFHNSEYRTQEPQLAARLTDKHILFSLENTNYRPVDLNEILGWNLKQCVNSKGDK